ncbi:GFA family protein [Salinarimonas rosea]|uniref:GFA family protein n=1 Tax=Salinarimonas rosea TaxID=552063 RepID=UPI00041C99E0|nr:GFA family protein [Salinarimonas rosea]
MRHDGGCLCGKVRYSVTTPPTRVTFCHCKFCQRTTGSAYLVEPIFDKGAFGVTAGEPTTYDHTSEGSGKVIHIHFCSTCATKLFLTFERFTEVVGVYGGTFDDPNWFERSPANSKHIFLAVAQRGTVVPAGVACFEEHATNVAGEPNEPHLYDSPHVV